MHRVCDSTRNMEEVWILRRETIGADLIPSDGYLFGCIFLLFLYKEDDHDAEDEHPHQNGHKNTNHIFCGSSLVDPLNSKENQLVSSMNLESSVSCSLIPQNSERCEMSRPAIGLSMSNTESVNAIDFPISRILIKKMASRAHCVAACGLVARDCQ